MRGAIASILVLLALSSSASGKSTDFEDMVPDVAYELGSSLVSGSVRFQIVPGLLVHPQGRGQVVVFGSSSSNQLFSGNTIGIGPFAGLSIMLPDQGVREIAFSFFDTGASVLAVNGVRTPFPGHLPTSNGQVLGGTLLDIESIFPTGNPNHGRVTLTGPIQSLVIHGSEMSIDNLSYIVPEPSTGALLLMGTAGLLLKRRNVSLVA